MALTTARIQVASKDVNEYHKGVALYELGAVSIIRSDNFWKGEINLTAQVQTEAFGTQLQNEEESNHSDVCTVVLSVAEDRIRNWKCSNPGCMGSRYGMCRHAVAAAVHLVMKGAAVTASAGGEEVHTMTTTPALKKLMHSYEDLSWNRSLAYHQDQEVSLVPKLKFAERSAAVSFSIGHVYHYLVKDLYTFAEDVLEGRQREYGKKLNLTHSLDRFDPVSRQYAEFIIDQTAARQDETPAGAGYGYYQRSFRLPAQDVREIRINRYNADGLMDILRSRQTVQMEALDGTEGELKICEGFRRMKVCIEPVADQGVKLLIDMNNMQFFTGYRHIYLCDFTENVLYIAGEKESRALMPFLEWLSKRSLSSALNARIYSGEISREDYPQFCARILKVILPYLDLEVPEEAEPAQYFPDPLKNHFYFDLAEDGGLYLRLDQFYGDFQMDPEVMTDAQLEKKGIFRDYGAELACRDLVRRYFDHRDDRGEYVTENPDRIFALLDGGIHEFASLGEVYATDAFNQKRTIRRMKKPGVKVSVESGLLEMDLSVDEAEAKELNELLASYRARKNYYRLKDGSFLRLAGREMEALDALTENGDIRIDKQGRIRTDRYRLLYVAEQLKRNAAAFDTIETSVDYRQELEAIRFDRFRNKDDFDSHETILALPETVRAALRPYQKTGVVWMKMLADHAFSGILADEMGLGKTVEVIALLCLGKGPSLIVCPASLVYNWENEFERFAPWMKTLIIAGDASERMEQIAEIGDYQVVITSYDLLRRDVQFHEQVHYEYEIIDEAQYIKNYGTMNAKAVKEITADHKFALTGTPIENRLSELWSIFDYCMPGFLQGHDRFRKKYELPIVKMGDPARTDQLRTLCGPFILRRLKKDVLSELPPKQEMVITVRLAEDQKKLYLAESLKLKTMLQSQTAGQVASDKIRILAELMRLRQICCDPALCFANYNGGSAKLDACIRMVESAVSSGHKILVFSQFTSMLDRIRTRLDAENIGYFCLTGATSKEDRIRMVKLFQQNRAEGVEERPVFLISLKAGGTGLNLTAADIVIHYDPWWNLAAQNQATDRVHRIGQENPVTVYKLIAKGSIEEKILKLQERKQELADSVITDSDSIFASLDKEELLSLFD